MIQFHILIGKKRYKKLMKKLKDIEDKLDMMLVDMDEENDDAKPEWDKEAEAYIDYQIKLADWERAKEKKK
jgi:hypothetical protein